MRILRDALGWVDGVSLIGAKKGSTSPQRESKSTNRAISLFLIFTFEMMQNWPHGQSWIFTIWKVFEITYNSLQISVSYLSDWFVFYIMMYLHISTYCLITLVEIQFPQRKDKYYIFCWNILMAVIITVSWGKTPSQWGRKCHDRAGSFWKENVSTNNWLFPCH